MRYKGLVVLCMLTVMFAPLRAQDSTRYGLGLNLIDWLSFDRNDVESFKVFSKNEFPVINAAVITLKYTINFELGMWRSIHNHNTWNEQITKERTQMLHLGVKMARYYTNDTKIKTYLGARIAMDKLNYVTNNISGLDEYFKVDYSRTDISVGPCFGTEYYLTHNLVLGGEAQAQMTFMGKTNRELIGVGKAKKGANGDFLYRTKMLVYLYWYF